MHAEEKEENKVSVTQTFAYLDILWEFWETFYQFDVTFINRLFMVALCNRADHIYFHPVSFFFFFFFFISSPNLSGRRLDVCHTSTYGVALLRI